MIQYSNTRSVGIWLKTLSLAATFALLVYVSHLFLFNTDATPELQSLTVSIAFCLLGLLLIATGVLLGLKVYRLRKEERAERILPEIRSAWAQRIGFGEGNEEVGELYRRYPAETEAVAAEVLSRLRGESLDSAAVALQEIGLVDRWKAQLDSISESRRQRALHLLSCLPARFFGDSVLRFLNDPSEQVRIEAFRCVASIGDRMLIEAVFPKALEGSRYVRTLLSNVFREHVDLLAEDILPEIISEGDDQLLIALLEFLLVAEQAVFIKGMETLAEHPNPQVISLLEIVRPYLIDTEIGLPSRQGRRESDAEAREFINSDVVFNSTTESPVSSAA